MVSELQHFIDEKRVFFGMRESSRNAKKLEKVFVSADARSEAIALLTKHNVQIEKLDFNKKELADKLDLAFQCEVFGVHK